VNQPVAVTAETLRRAAAILRSGGVVAFPTETYYGLAVDPLSRLALERLLQVKQRPRTLPILALVADIGQLRLLVNEIPEVYEQLIDCFWPGPLTLAFPAQPAVPPQLTGDTGTVGLRQSPHATANQLIAAFGGPITATSANMSGFLAAVTASEVAQIFGTAVDLILDGGTTPGGSGSTIVGISGASLYCFREGKIPFSAVQQCAAAHDLKY
jgi:L-threonylcarbamoyladenylate synthase